MNIRLAEKEDFDLCVSIAKRLPEWFDGKEIQEISKDVTNLPTFLIEEEAVGAFVCIEEKSQKVIEIKHLAVDKDHRREGYGTQLVNYVEEEYPDKEIIMVKTLDESVDYEPYEATRSFYEKNGFIKVDTVDPYPGWSPGNPCVIYVKKLHCK